VWTEHFPMFAGEFEMLLSQLKIRHVQNKFGLAPRSLKCAVSGTPITRKCPGRPVTPFASFTTNDLTLNSYSPVRIRLSTSCRDGLKMEVRADRQGGEYALPRQAATCRPHGRTGRLKLPRPLISPPVYLAPCCLVVPMSIKFRFTLS
jgi:hypothetical protein